MFTTSPPPQAGEGVTVASDLLSGCHGDGAGGGDTVHLSIRQGRRGEGLLQENKADASEVEVFGDTGGVSGPGGKAVSVGGGAEEGQVTLTGTASPVVRWGLCGGAR